MKLLLLVTFIAAAAAEAEPEADPYFYYGYGGWPYAGLGYAGHYGYGGHYGYAGYAGLTYTLPKVTYTAPACTNNDGAAVPCAHPYGWAYGYYPYGLHVAAAPAADEAAVEEARKKRDADADPAVLATYSHVTNPSPTIYHGLPHALPLTYAGLPYAHGFGYGLGLHGLGYGYGWPLLHHAAVAAPAEDAVEEARKKRDADAEPEADPWLYYSGGLGYGYGYGYAGYGYPYTYGHYPYAYHAGAGCRNYLGAAVPCA